MQCIMHYDVMVFMCRESQDDALSARA